MKKILILLFVFLLAGCTNVVSSTLTFDTAVMSVLKEEKVHFNTFGKGFKYYKPRGFSLLVDDEYNHTLLNNGNKYYLNIDINGYYNKRADKYLKDTLLYYSNSFKYNDILGYLEIRDGNNGYFYIKMMYNYSYIEVGVKEFEIKEAVIHSAIILSSIKYNDTVIERIISKGDLSDKETTYEIEKPESESKNMDVYENDIYEE